MRMVHREVWDTVLMVGDSRTDMVEMSRTEHQ